MQSLGQLPLVDLNLEENEMSHCLELLVLPSGMPSLKKLDLKNCSLTIIKNTNQSALFLSIGNSGAYYPLIDSDKEKANRQRDLSVSFESILL